MHADAVNTRLNARLNVYINNNYWKQKSSFLCTAVISSSDMSLMELSTSRMRFFLYQPYAVSSKEISAILISWSFFLSSSVHFSYDGGSHLIYCHQFFFYSTLFHCFLGTWYQGLSKVLWKAVARPLNLRIKAAILFHDTLHGFWAGRGAGTAALEAKLLQ